MIDRVSTASLYQQNLSDISSVQLDLAKLNKQISSGSKADTWDQLNGSVELVSGYQTKISSIDSYTSSNTVINARLNTMDQSVSQLQTIAEQYASLVSQRRNATTGTSINFATQANSMLNQIAQALNSQISGRYLFAGSQTDTPPVSTPIPDPATAGTADNNYYNGSQDILTARINDGQQISYGVTADNPAFQNLISAIKTGLAGDSTGSDANFAQSIDQINSAINGLADVKTSIDTNITTLQNVTDQNSSLKLYWQQALSDSTSTDVASASIQLAADQTTLQATFQAFAGLTKLKLTDYL